MRFSIWLILFLSLFAACRFDPSGIGPDASNPGDDTGVPDGGVPDASPDAPPGCNDECVNNDTQYCDGTGVAVDCPFGCGTTGGAHCMEIAPSNGADDSDLTGVTSGLTIASGEVGTIDTDTGLIEIDGSPVRGAVLDGVDAGMGFYRQVNGTSVLAVSSLTVDSGGTLQPSGTRPLIIWSASDVTIGGLIDISGGCADGTPDCPGPGGGRGATNTNLAQGCAPGGDGVAGGGASDNSVDETGGGGGGLGLAGAPGGNGAAAELGGLGGIPLPANCPGANLITLRGGSGGGEGGPAGGYGGDGGGGGGSLQITSKTQILFMSGGEIWAGGAGGAPGGSSNHDGGGGGGSGGAILLEAPVVTAAGAIVTANGGGGGGGGSGARAGDKGTRTTMQAAGGRGGGTTLLGEGGVGGALDGVAGQGEGGVDGTGGGGGSVGIIRINAPADKLDINNATISPAHSRGEIVVQ